MLVYWRASPFFCGKDHDHLVFVFLTSVLIFVALNSFQLINHIPSQILNIPLQALFGIGWYSGPYMDVFADVQLIVGTQFWPFQSGRPQKWTNYWLALQNALPFLGVNWWKTLGWKLVNHILHFFICPFFSPLILGCVGQPWLLLDDITVFWFILSLISLLQAQLPLAKNPPRDHKSFSFWGYTLIVGNVSKFWAYWRHNPSLDLVWSSWMFWLTLICFRWMRFRYKDEAQDTLRESISIILSLVINPNLTSYLRFQDGELWSLSLRIMPPSNGWSDSLIFVG